MRGPAGAIRRGFFFARLSAQQQWGKLTNDDLDVVKGKRKELAGRIQERYGKAEEEAERDIDDWLARH